MVNRGNDVKHHQLFDDFRSRLPNSFRQCFYGNGISCNHGLIDFDGLRLGRLLLALTRTAAANDLVQTALLCITLLFQLLFALLALIVIKYTRIAIFLGIIVADAPFFYRRRNRSGRTRPASCSHAVMILPRSFTHRTLRTISLLRAAHPIILPRSILLAMCGLRVFPHTLCIARRCIVTQHAALTTCQSFGRALKFRFRRLRFFFFVLHRLRCLWRHSIRRILPFLGRRILLRAFVLCFYCFGILLLCGLLC